MLVIPRFCFVKLYRRCLEDGIPYLYYRIPEGGVQGEGVP